jgi:serine/threonine protein phosphatase PrpC
LRAESLSRLTTDHSALQSLLKSNLITAEEANRHSEPSEPTRSLGREPMVEIDIEQHTLAVGDTLLLCSHGLWESVPEKEIEEAAAETTLETAGHKLLELSLAAGGRENIALELLRLIPPIVVVPSESAPGIEEESRLPKAFKLVVTVFLLAVAGLCVLAYFVLRHHGH